MYPNIHIAKRFDKEIDFGEEKEYSTLRINPSNLSSKPVGAGEAEPTSSQEKLVVSYRSSQRLSSKRRKMMRPIFSASPLPPFNLITSPLPNELYRLPPTLPNPPTAPTKTEAWSGWWGKNRPTRG